MARIIVSDCEKKEKSPRKQEVVKATYSVNTNEGLFQIETYGSSSRQNSDSASQTFQIDKDSAQQLIALLEKELFLQKSWGAFTDDFPLQQIFYGAPGTGKSHKVNETTQIQPEENVFRTTFHPDSDYSTFVGCYKPTMINEEPLYKVGELINKLSEIKTSGETYPCHKFAAKYWESIKDLSADEIKKILTACGFTESMTVEIGKGIAIGEDFAKKSDNKKIVYSFVPQVFTKAYLRAWQTTEPVYLVIEEINRGNCAQIFGDLFQLLDRKCDGFSEYPIKADNDLAAYIAEKLSSSSRADIPELVRSGEELMLPSNLYIWATMNTSDQSLFPIDSAFKRRWEWKYIPISYKNKDWVIEIGDKTYMWVDFQREINNRIYSIDNSEDKQLGDFFVDANRTGNVMSADTLLNKILFYIWNDVCKDDPDQIFRWIDYKDKKEKSIRFSDFFTDDKDQKLQGLMSFLGIKTKGEAAEEEEETPIISTGAEESETDVVTEKGEGE